MRYLRSCMVAVAVVVMAGCPAVSVVAQTLPVEQAPALTAAQQTLKTQILVLLRKKAVAVAEGDQAAADAAQVEIDALLKAAADAGMSIEEINAALLAAQEELAKEAAPDATEEGAADAPVLDGVNSEAPGDGYRPG